MIQNNVFRVYKSAEAIVKCKQSLAQTRATKDNKFESNETTKERLIIV
jgi:hypothetical protein